ncbi:MAG TPA: hypothetical protein ENI61_07320 [Ignavibacteria bacterium]|nr:hypothetical protein [Ignavibacteria bacterium]
MKKNIFLLFISFSLFQIKLYSQHLALGFEVPIVINNTNVHIGNGVNFSFEYKMFNVFSLSGDLGGVSALTNGSKLVSGSYSLFWAEADIQIKKVKGEIQPYLGIGIGYYKTDINLAALTRFVADNNVLSEMDVVQYKLGYNLQGGLDIPLSSVFVFETEIKYVIFNPRIRRIYKDINTSKSFTVNEHPNLNTFFFQFGLKVVI